MMMLIFSIIVIYSYLYSVYLFSVVLKDTHFKEHLSLVASKYSFTNMENKTANNIAIMEKAWFYEKLFFKVIIVMVKNNKIQHKRYNVNQN